MIDLLSFITVVIVRIIDPLTILVAVAIGAFATVSKQRSSKWIVIGVGAVVMTVSSLLLSSYLDSISGLSQSHPWTPMRIMTTLTASALQIAIAAFLINWFKQRHASGTESYFGVINPDGQGVAQNYVDALKQYRNAADQGDAEAMSALALMYSEGRGAPQDYVSAHVWYNLSAARGVRLAEANRDIVEQHMTTAQIAEAQKLASEWTPTKQ